MKRIAKLAVAATIVLLVPLLSVGAEKNLAECAIFEAVPGEAGEGDVASTVSSPACVGLGLPGAVEVGTWGWSPNPIELELSERLVLACKPEHKPCGTVIEPGVRTGVAKVYKKRGIFYFRFEWDGTLQDYRYRLTVRNGIYDEANDAVIFDLFVASMRLDDQVSGEWQELKEGIYWTSFMMSFPGGESCLPGLGSKGDPCTDDSECCSGNCTGKTGAKTCK